MRKRDSDEANQGSEEHFTRGSNDAMIVNENCSNGSAYVSPSTVNRVQDDNIVNATQGGSEAETLQCRGYHQITTRIAITTSNNSSYGMIK